MAAGQIDWGGCEPPNAVVDFATSLNELIPGLDYWLHADGNGTPWLLVSLDIIEGERIRATLRLDFDEHGIRGGWSPACLNWDDGVRAEDAQIDLSGPDGLQLPAEGSPPTDMARHAAEWFTSPKTGRWADAHSSWVGHLADS